jgi:UDP-glucose 4-epimerase
VSFRKNKKGEEQMLNNFKITLIVKNEKIESLNLSKKENSVLSEVLESYSEIENLNIRVSSLRRRKGFVDFVSTNKKTIKENLDSYFTKDYVEDLDLNSMILEELEQMVS